MLKRFVDNVWCRSIAGGLLVGPAGYYFGLGGGLVALVLALAALHFAYAITDDKGPVTPLKRVKAAFSDMLQFLFVVVFAALWRNLVLDW
jgi:hypothetical protein